MAIFKTVSPKDHYKDDRVYQSEIDYIQDPEKTSVDYIVFQGVSSIETAAQEMRELTELYGKNHGTRIRHMVLSFAPHERVTLRQAADITRAIINFFGPAYQMVGAVHALGTDNLHIHFIMNPVRISDGKKYSGHRREYYELREYIKTLLKEYGCRYF